MLNQFHLIQAIGVKAKCLTSSANVLH